MSQRVYRCNRLAAGVRHKEAALGHGGANGIYSDPTPVVTMAGVQVRSVAAGSRHSLVLGWDGCVYAWGSSILGELENGDEYRDMPSSALVDGLDGVRSIAAADGHSLAVTHSGDVFRWGSGFGPDAEKSNRPILVEGFLGVRVSLVRVTIGAVHAIGQDGELFSWGYGDLGLLGHGDEEEQRSPKRVEALRGVRVSTTAFGGLHALALAESGLVYTWGECADGFSLGNPNVEKELPKPIEALLDVRVGSIATGAMCRYAVACTGEAWAWGFDSNDFIPLGYGEEVHSLVPKPVELLRGVKVDAVAAAHILLEAPSSPRPRPPSTELPRRLLTRIAHTSPSSHPKTDALRCRHGIYPPITHRRAQAEPVAVEWQLPNEYTLPSPARART
jgi:hypothetical protein